MSFAPTKEPPCTRTASASIRLPPRLPEADQLAMKIAAVAADPVAVAPDVAEMLINRVIDNAAVAIASVNRHPCISARDMALAHAPPGRSHRVRHGAHRAGQPRMGGLGQRHRRA